MKVNLSLLSLVYLIPLMELPSPLTLTMTTDAEYSSKSEWGKRFRLIRWENSSRVTSSESQEVSIKTVSL